MPVALPVHVERALHAGAGEVTVRVDAACDAAVLAGAPEHTLVSLAGGETSRTMRWVLAAPTGASLEITATSRHAGVAALRRRAGYRGLELPEDVARYLLRRLPRDMRALCDWLDRLDTASLAAGRRLTLPFVREVIAAERPERPA